MSAHPMIAPLHAVSPEAIAERYPPDAAALYRLLWDRTLAHLKGAPTGEHVRTVYGENSCSVAIDSIRLDAEGWLSVLPREAFPEAGVPDNEVAPSASALLEQCRYCVTPIIDREDDRGTEALLRWLDEWEIVSPGRLATLLGELVQAGLAVRQEDGQLAATAGGREQLRLAANSGHTWSALVWATWRVARDDYVAGRLSLTDLGDQTLRRLGVNIADALGWLDVHVEHGHSVEEAEAVALKAAVRPTGIEGLPLDLDPERVLDASDPWRVRRDTLEQSLSQGRAHAWLYLPSAQRTAIRLGCLMAGIADAELPSWMATARFDLRWRWLIGASLSDPVPDAHMARRAFEAWTAQQATSFPLPS